MTNPQRFDEWFKTTKNTRQQAYVAHQGASKTLHFDESCVQSRMRVDDPNALVLGYTRAMMGFLLFHPTPRAILIVGLGGGSLSKYCYHELPECTVTTVEINADVIALRDKFAIPADNERFRIVHADASWYMRDQHAVADIILLDGFDVNGLPDCLSTRSFYDRCALALRPGGVLAANLWGCGEQLEIYFSRIARSFNQRLLIAKSETSENRIAFGLKQVTLPYWHNLQQRARQLEHESGLNFTGLLDQLRASAQNSRGQNWLADSVAD